MTNKNKSFEDAMALRRKAEETLERRERAVAEDAAQSVPEEISKTLHELRVHQIELEMQNEELLAAHAALEASRSRYFNLYNLAPVAYCTITENGLILLANLTAAGMLGAHRSILIRQSIHQYIYKDDQDIYYLLRRRLFGSGQTQACELRMTKSDGTLFWARMDASPTEVEDQVAACHVVWTDITARKEAEATREILQDQLFQARKLESIGRLAGGVAHDFNNMLGVILGHVDFAIDKTDTNDSLQEHLTEIRTAAQRSAELTRQLLTFARKQNICVKKLDLNDTVSSMLTILRRLIGEDIDLTWRPAENVWPVKMDPVQIDQILVNLCVNARDAIDGVGRLLIETGTTSIDPEYCRRHPGAAPGDYALLTVSDNGCGMGKDTLANVFEPFFTTKEMGHGTGLGLATVYGIVKQNNGFIDVASAPGRGATFSVFLPRQVVDDEVASDVSATKPSVACRETILLVEDEPAILEVTRMMLVHKGYAVLTAATPGQALETAKNHAGDIALLITDVVMPQMNGRVLADQIIALCPDIKLLFMSGYTADIIARQGILDDGVPFIQKPFSMTALDEKLATLL